MSESQFQTPGCGGCGFIGGMGISRAGRYWHADCWIKHLETTLRSLAAYYQAGFPDEEDAITMGQIIEDALAARVRPAASPHGTGTHEP